MEALREIDANVVVWLNEWAGRSSIMDAAVRVIVSDYLIPASIGLCLMAMWFAGKNPQTRDTQHRAVITALAAVGFASLVVLILNDHFHRPRPFVDHDLTVLLYRPTDPSFPAHPAAVAFAMAASAWQGSRKLGTLVYGFALLWGISRIYAGVFYPMDVLAGAAIGVGMSYLVAFGLKLIAPVPTLVLRGAKTLHLA